MESQVRELSQMQAEKADVKLDYLPVRGPVPLKANFVPKNASVMRANQDKFRMSEIERGNNMTTNTMLVTAQSCNDSAIRSGVSNVHEPLGTKGELSKDA